MSLYINTNIASLIAQQSLNTNTQALNSDYQELSSGYRINHASDDAAGFEIANNLTAQVNGDTQAINNAQDGNNLLSVAEGTLDNVNDNLQRIRELVVEAANGTNGSEQITAITSEIKQRIAEITQATKSTSFNGRNILQSDAGSYRIQIGADSTASLNTIDISSALGSATASGLGLTSVSLSTSSKALATLANVDKALNAIGSRLALLGSFETRLQSVISNLQVSSQNYSSSEAQIKDVNVAAETADLTQNQILQQASASILTQANQTPQIALTLIKGA